jgi:hypothetical protein
LFNLGRKNMENLIKTGIQIFGYFGFYLISYDLETKDWPCSLTCRFFIIQEGQ